MTNHGEELRRVLQEFFDRRARGESPSPREYLDRHPHLRKELGEHFETVEALDRLVKGTGAVPGGETVLGDFRIVREIGHGAYGRVFLAEQVTLRRPVALKLLSAPLAQSYRTLERFRHEAEIAARLRHPNLVAVYAEGEAQGYAYYAMEQVEGISLAQVLEKLRALGPSRLHSLDLRALVRGLAPPPEKGRDEEGPAPPAPVRPLAYFGAVAHLVAEIADGLAYAHGRGVIHRDVKPGNVLVDRALVPHLADFGLAKETGLESLSITGDLVGTPYYLSPEIAKAGRIEVDHRTDIYSLGVTLYELLTLRVPFSGTSSHEVLRRIVLEPPAAPRKINHDVPRDLQVIALKAMEKDPDHRYATAAEMAEDLRRFLRFEPIRATPPGPIRVAGRYLRRHRVAAGIAAFALLASGAGGAIHAARVARSERDTRLASAGRLEAGGALWNARGEFRGLVENDPGDREAAEGLRRVTTKIEADVQSLVAEAEEAIRSAGDGEGEHLRQVAALKLERALALRGGVDPALRGQLDQVLGGAKISFVSEPGGAEITLFDVHEASGELGPPRRLERTPLRGVHLTLGWYRALLDIAGFGYAEISFEVVREEVAKEIVVTLRRTEEVTAGMVRIGAGEYRIGKPPGPRGAIPAPFHLGERVVDSPSFFIDPVEVSNAEYEKFVVATRRTPPSNWGGPGGRYRSGEGDHHVVEVTWEDARAFSEWAGKRLPTEVEWEIACRGPDGRLFPWGEEFDASRDVLGSPLPEPVKAGRHDYQGFRFSPVGSMLESRSPFGVLHLAGNVSEWVWEPWRVAADVSPREAPKFAPMGRRVIRGGSAVEPLQDPHYCSCVGRRALHPTLGMHDVGFRCAKSARE